MKQFIQKALGKAGYKIEKMRPYPDPEQALSTLDYVLHYLNELRNGHVRFVQIGANDGRKEDPCYAWVTNFPWSGVLIEPQPRLVEYLRYLHQKNPRIQIEQALIAAEPGTRTLHYFKDLPQWDGIASTDKENMLRQHGHKIKNVDYYLKSMDIEAVTLPTLMERHRIDQLDFLQIDTEGMDYEILKSIDFGSVQPAVLNYEHCNLSPDEQIECRNMLAKHGYLFTTFIGDTIAVHKSLEIVSRDRSTYLGLRPVGEVGGEDRTCATG